MCLIRPYDKLFELYSIVIFKASIGQDSNIEYFLYVINSSKKFHFDVKKTEIFITKEPIFTKNNPSYFDKRLSKNNYKTRRIREIKRYIINYLT